jgi:hypothetical protein
MRIFLLLALVFILPFGLKAQTVVQHPFPVDSAAWYETSSKSEGNFMPVFTCNKKLYYNGYDTVANKVYSRLFSTRFCVCSEQFFQNPCPGNFPNGHQDELSNILFRTDSNKVYIKRSNYYTFNGLDTSEHVLYDYNIQVGDSFEVDGYFGNFKLPCVLVDSFLTNTGYRKQWNFVDWMVLPDTLKWIEGATSNLGLFYDENIGVIVDYSSYGKTNCFAQGDTFVLGNGFAPCEYLVNSTTEHLINNKINIYPNPATTEFTVVINSPTQSMVVQLYNSLGQQVGSYSAAGNQVSVPRNNLPGGLYVVQLQSGSIISRHKVLFTN